MAKSSGSIIAFLLGAVFLAVGFGLGLYIGKPILDKAKASESWPMVLGTIVESSLQKKRDKDSTTYTAAVAYEYEVDGQILDGDEIWFGQYSSNDRSEMAKLVREYPVGKAVTVYYSPEDSSDAVLKPGAFTSSYIIFVIGMIFLGIGCLLVLAPVLKMVFLSTMVATSADDSFAGGGDGFSASDSGGYDHKQDGFDGIPGS